MNKYYRALTKRVEYEAFSTPRLRPLIKSATTPTIAALTNSMLASILVLTGCGAVPSPPALTIAVTATSNEPAPSTAALVDMLTEHAKAALMPGDGIVTVVTPGTVTQVDLTPMRGDQVEGAMAKIDAKIRDNLAVLEEVVSTAAATSDGLDVIGVLDRALEATRDGGRVVIATSGFSTVSPLDWNSAGGWIAHPERFVDVVDSADLPDATGKSITFLGLGYPHPDSGQQTAGPAARDALITAMTGLCEKMNAISCDTLPGPVSADHPTSTNIVPLVELNQVTTHCVGQVEIDTSIAFDPESDILKGSVDSQLAPIAEALASCPTGTIVNAVGHSAAVPHPSWGGGPDLEVRRAQAVLNRLPQLGAPAETLGTATAGGQIIDNMPDGKYREELAIHNRVVTLVVSN